MKRIFPFFLAGILLLSFSACSSETSGPAQVSSTESSTVQPPETDSDATQSSSNTMKQETVSPNSDSNILIAYFTMPEDVDDNYQHGLPHAYPYSRRFFRFRGEPALF